MSDITVESPFPVAELPRVWLWMQETPSLLDVNIGPKTMDEFVDDWMNRTALTFGVWRDGVLGGMVAYEPLDASTGALHCVFKKGATRADSFLGRKNTIPAAMAVFADLFAIGVERITMTVFQSNHAIQSLIKDIGGELEAIFFHPCTTDGQEIIHLYHGEPQPLLQYTVYASTFGKPNERGRTYNDWIKSAVSKELAARAAGG